MDPFAKVAIALTSDVCPKSTLLNLYGGLAMVTTHKKNHRSYDSHTSMHIHTRIFLQTLNIQNLVSVTLSRNCIISNL